MHELIRMLSSSVFQEGPAGEPPAPLEMPAWIPEPIGDLWRTIEAQPLLGFAVIVVASFLVAKLVEVVITRGAARLTAKTETRFDDRLIALLHRPVFLTVFLGGLAVATRSLGLAEGWTQGVVRVLRTIVLLAWLGAGFPIIRLTLDALGKVRDRFEMIEERTIPLFDITSRLVLIGGGAWVFLKIWDIDATPWVASAGVVGIAVGFAARDTLANLFSGFFIVADAPYKLGDFVVLPTGERGMVTNVGMRSTRILTRDDIEITMPNALMANAKIVNESGGRWEKERIRIKVGVAYGSDVDRVCEVLNGVALGHDHVCREPAPRVRLRGFGASSLDFELLCWIDEPVLRGKLSHELYMDVYRTFAELGIEIPYDKTDVYIKETPAAL